MLPTIVGVTGMWHPASCFEDLEAAFKEKGYPFICQDAPGILDEDPFNSTVDKDSQSLRQNILLPLLAEGKDVVLLMHSYGGIYGSAAVAGLSARERKKAGLQGGVTGLLYITAVTPAVGKFLLDMMGLTPENLPPHVVMDEPRGQILLIEAEKHMYHNIPKTEADKWIARIKPQAYCSINTPISYSPLEDENYKGLYLIGEIEAMSTTNAPPESAAFLAENRQAEVYAVATVFFALSLLAVSGRLTAARLQGKPLWWDDWFAIVAGICGIGGYITTMLYLRFGLGRHAVVVAQEDPQNLSRFLQTIVANEIVYTTGLACARLSIVFLYYRIFGTSNMRYFLHGFTAIIIAWTIGTFIPSIRTCWPISSFWDGTNQNCIDLHGFYVGVAVGSIVTDFGLMVLPMPYIWNLKVPMFQKILLALTMVFGGFACFVTIFRLAIVVSLDLSDLTWNTVDQIIWTTLELFCAIICACLPTLRPLIKRARGFLGLSGYSSRGDGNLEAGKSGNSGLGRIFPTPHEYHSAEEILVDYRGDNTELADYNGELGGEFGQKSYPKNTVTVQR